MQDCVCNQETRLTHVPEQQVQRRLPVIEVTMTKHIHLSLCFMESREAFPNFSQYQLEAIVVRLVKCLLALMSRILHYHRYRTFPMIDSLLGAGVAGRREHCATARMSSLARSIVADVSGFPGCRPRSELLLTFA
jgi:hypothetical protein